MGLEEIKINCCENVYKPREDSYLLAKAVEEYAFGKALDFGTGTGIQGITAAIKKCDVTFADVDENAIQCARNNARLNKVKGEFVHSDMFSSINEKFNTIIFNPPYLESDGINDTALDGGPKGRLLIDRFLKEYKNYLMPDHNVLLLESSINDYEKDVKRLRARIIGKEHYFFEDLVVLLFK